MNKILETIKRVKDAGLKAVDLGEQKAVDLGVLNDVSKFEDKANAASGQALSFVEKATTKFKASINFYENALSAVNKGIGQAKDLGADNLVKQLGDKKKRIQGWLSGDKKNLSKVNSI